MMFAVYFFENENLFNGELRQEFAKFGFTLDYETSLHKFLTKIKNFRPNVVLVDYDSPIFNKIFSEALGVCSEFFVPCVIAISSDEKSFGLPNSFLIKRGKDEKEQIHKILSQHSKMINNNFFLTQKRESFAKNISKILEDFGFPQKLNGTIYFKDCLKFYVGEEMRTLDDVGVVLGKVAIMHNKKLANVERCIRTLISKMFNNPDKKVFNNLFKSKPSTKEFIRVMAEYVVDMELYSEKISKIA